MYNHILTALDGSDAAEQVFPHVESLARAFRAQVTLLRVAMPPVDVVAAEAAAEAIPPTRSWPARASSGPT